jgi:tetratricopeptide (TPR) repeat protein
MSQKFCSACGQKVSETAKFCPQCGARLGAGGSASQKGSSPKRGIRDTAIIVGALVVVAVGYFLFMRPEAPPQPPKTQANNMPAGHPSINGMDSTAMNLLNNLPPDYNSLVELGHKSYDAGNYPVAAECYRRALAIDGSSLDLRTDYGASLNFMGLPDRAIEEFRKVLKENPDHGIANFNMGIVYYNLQKNDSAKFYWTKYLKLDPTGSAADQARKLLKEIGG